MKVKPLSIIIVIFCFLLLSGCATDKMSNDETQNNSDENEIRYECTHGISNLEYYTTGIDYTGEPIAIDYSFSNGSIAANYGLLVFLDSQLQEFSVDGDLKLMHIISLDKNMDKTISLSINPKLGGNGESLSLKIVAIFDADTNYESPTIGSLFYNAMSQSFPIRINFVENANEPQPTSYSPLYNLSIFESNSANISETDLKSADRIEIVTDAYITSKDSFFARIYNTSEDTHQYNLYAFVNHCPITINNAEYLPIECPSKRITEMSCLLENRNGPSPNDLIYYIAVPVSDVDIDNPLIILKTSTIPITAHVEPR